jgi:hypothetical protein
MTRLLFVLLGAAALAVASPATPAGAGAATVTTFANFHQTGGFVGVDVHLVVRTNGTLVVTHRGEPSVRGKLRPATFRRLRTALDAAHLERRLPPSQNGCADCFVYSIGYRGHHAAFDDATFPARMRAAVTQLRRIADGGR